MDEREREEERWRGLLGWVSAWGMPALMMVPYTPEELGSPESEAWATCSKANCFARARFACSLNGPDALVQGTLCREHLVELVAEVEITSITGEEFPP